MSHACGLQSIDRSAANGATPAWRRSQRGVTLMEVMIVLVIAAILLAIGIPGFQEFVVRNRLNSAGQEMLTSLQLARSEAVRRGVQVTLRRCKADADSKLPYEPGNWRSGWTMWAELNAEDIPEECGFCDQDKDPREDLDEAPCKHLIRQGWGLEAPLRLVGRGFEKCVAFGQNGELTEVETCGAGGEFVVCQQKAGTDDKKRAQAVLVNAAGRVRMALDTNKDGELERDDGEAVDVKACGESK